MEEAMMGDKLETDDPAKEFGSLEDWNGKKHYVLRNEQGHFVTWRLVGAAEQTQTEQTAVADGGFDLSSHDYGELMSAKGESNGEVKDLDADVTRWTQHGHDRLYINNVWSSTNKVWVDLKSGEIEKTGPSTPTIRDSEVRVKDGQLVVTIHAASRHYHLEVSIRDDTDDVTETTDESNDNQDDNSGPDLEKFGMTI